MFKILSVALGVFACVAATSSDAGATSKCQAAKLKAAGNKASCLLGLDSNAAGGKTVDPSKFTACGTKMSKAFTKADGGTDCSTSGDAAEIEHKIDLAVADVNAALSKGGASKCQAAKLKAASKKAKCLLGLESKEAAKGTKDATKVAACKTKFSDAFTKAQGRTDCKTSGDTTAIEDKIDTLVADIDCELDGAPACTCGSPMPAFLAFTTKVGTGTCGDVTDDTAMSLFTLACNTLYIGGSGAGAVPPGVVPDYGTVKLKVCCSANNLFLARTTAADTGSNRNCTAVGCLYGAPLPITNTAVPPLSSCVINEVATDASGIGACDAGSTTFNIPLTSHVHLDGDTLPKRCSASTTSGNKGRKCMADPDCPGGTCDDDSADIQPCPICNPDTLKCNGGPDDGNPCTPGTLLAPGPAFPTSHDCQPVSPTPLANLAIPYMLTTGAATKTAVDLPSQTHVFCGFCGSASSATFKNPPVPCTSDTDCAGLTGCPSATACSACKQRNPGAFKPSGGPARTITENGMPAGAISTGSGALPATLGTVFCVPPTFAAGGLVDSSADLPGPGATGLKGTLQLLP